MRREGGAAPCRMTPARGGALALVLMLSGPASAPAQRSKVYLNHAVLVVDSATYAAVNASPFVRDTLGRLRQYTIQAGGGASWTGSYLFGKNTYVELFGPGGVAGPAGFGMISYGVEEPGAIWRVRARLAEATRQPIDSLLQSRARGGPGSEEVPWFYAVSVRGVMTESALPSWVMEYHPSHNRLWDASLPPERDGILRWQALATEHDSTRPFLDVVGVTAAVNPADRERLLAEGRAIGYRVEGGTMTGPEVVIRLEPATPNRRGITEIVLGLRPGALAPGTRRFGPRSRIAVDGSGIAVWRFE